MVDMKFERFKLIKILTVLSFFISNGLIYKQYLPENYWLCIPYFDLELPYSLSILTLLILAGSLVLTLIYQEALLITVSVFIFHCLFINICFLLTFNIYYLVILMILYKNTAADVHFRQSALILFMTSVYFWSGLSKFNPGFREESFPNLINTIVSIKDLNFLLFLGYFAALFELIAAIGLMISKFKKVACQLLIFMHIFILIVLGPIGLNYGYAVWVWNILAIILLNQVSSFEKSNVINGLLKSSFSKKLGMATIVLVLPLMSIFKFAPALFKWPLHSGNTGYDYQCLDEPFDKELINGVHYYKENVLFIYSKFYYNTTHSTVPNDYIIREKLHNRLIKRFESLDDKFSTTIMIKDSRCE